MIKKVLPYLLAVLVFFVALALLRPAPQTQVVVAAADLPAGRTLAEGDLALKPMPQDLLPTEGVIDGRGAGRGSDPAGGSHGRRRDPAIAPGR